MKKLLLIGVICLLAGCESHYEKEAKQAVVDQLKDPASVEWKDVRSKERVDSLGKKRILVCGQYNAKNSYGGYRGFEEFVWDDGELLTGSLATDQHYRCPPTQP
jgi:hypothetical protein